MMGTSDNAAAILLQDLVGSSNVNRGVEALGLTASRLTEAGDLPMTAADVALLLEAIARGEAVSEHASETMIDLMTREIFENGLRSGLPPDTRLAHKTGIWTMAWHDGGIVFAPFGTYLIVVLSEREQQRAAVRALSEAAYQYLSER
jgi:beta-lactamase class A